MDTSTGERAPQSAPARWAAKARSLGNAARDGVAPLRKQLGAIRERAAAAAAARGPMVASLTAANGVGGGASASHPQDTEPATQLGFFGAGMTAIYRAPIAQVADAEIKSAKVKAAELAPGDDARPILISSVEFDAEDPDLAQLATIRRHHPTQLLLHRRRHQS